MLKSYGVGGGGWVGGPYDFSVSPSPFGLDFGTLDFGLGLDNNELNYVKAPPQVSYASSKFELILFTASPSLYAKRVLDHIDPEHRFFDHKLYREFCHYHQVGKVNIKFLTKI